jgi:HD-GYP domain-containing protein (c-di-GMP phosphodiesterase class II)
LSVAQIPLGARILSVVDCFDALTSDRPYRAAVSGNDALRTLLASRGTKYDPSAVDVFTRMCQSAGSEVDTVVAA